MGLFALQLVAPLGLIAVLALVPWRSRTTLVLAAITVGAYILSLALAGLWLVLPWYLPFVYAVLYVLALRRAARRGEVTDAIRPGRRSARAAPLLLLAVGAVGLTARAIEGRIAPRGTVDLAFPLKGGTYLVVSGGGNTLVSAHQMTRTGERYHAWRGQSDGVDLVRIDGLGRRAQGMRPSDPAAYFIFGDTVYAPCAGAVVSAADGLPDQQPPIIDRAHMAGNHVILACGGLWVLLGHLQQGSVLVSRLDRIAAGEPLGQVGNTGNSDEPHLHIHAQTPGTSEAPFSGTPVAIRLDGRYLARNDRISGRPVQASTSQQ